MAIITFRTAAPLLTAAFPISPLRQLLTATLPDHKWQCGEEDLGGKADIGHFHDHMLIAGRSSDTIVFTDLRTVDAVLPGAPPHLWHLNVGTPTTEIQLVADRIVTAICSTLMTIDKLDSRCQLQPGGAWLAAQDVQLMLDRVLAGEPLSLVTGAPPPAAAAQPGDPVRAAPPPSAIGPSEIRQRMLAPITLMHERPLRPDWATIARFARELDPEGDWHHQNVPGMDLLLGRGTRVVVHGKGAPFPDFVYEHSFDRSFWFKGDRRRIAAHRCHTAIGCALDTAKADWVTIRQTAKVVSLVAGLLARLPGMVAVHNLDTDAIFEPFMVSDFVKFLSRGQIPVMLWTWTKWHSLADGNVCLSTSGLMPFLGHEIEVWNAPLSCKEVQTQVSDLIIYLLDHGPTIGHGDTAGRTSDDQSIRCFLGESRAARPTPVQALFLEFGEKGEIQPRPDLPEASDSEIRAPLAAGDPGEQAARMIDGALQSIIANSASPAMRQLLTDVMAARGAEAGQGAPGATPAPPATPPRRPGGFGRKGL